MTASAGKRKRIMVRGPLRPELDPTGDTSVPQSFNPRLADLSNILEFKPELTFREEL